MTNDQLMQAQIELENNYFNGGIVRFEASQARHEENGESSQTAWNRRLISEFVAPMAEGLQAYKDEYSSRKGKPAKALAYLQCVGNEVASYITMKVALDMLASGVSYTAIAMTIAARIEDQARFTKLEGAAEKYIAKVLDNLKRNNSKKYQHGHNVMVAAEQALSQPKPGKEAAVTRWIAWPQDDLLAIGMALLQIMERSVFFEGEPVFFRFNKNDNGGGKVKLVPVLGVSENVNAWIEAFKEHVSVLSPAYGPCVVPPRDWKTPFNGGFHTEAVASRVKFVKGRTDHVRKLTQKQMPKVYKAVNFLQSVKWAINTETLETAKEVFEKNLGLGMPSIEPIITRNNKPACPLPMEFQHLRGEELRQALTPTQWDSFLAWKGDCSKLYTMETKRTSKAGAVSRMLRQAEDLSKYPAIHFVYAMDSRGRVYVQSAGVSPQSDDLGKSLLRSAKGKKLDTAEALHWFLVLGGNLWGVDKKPFSVRVSHVLDDDFAEMVRDIAADPFTFRGWLSADEPWQFLAWAKEYARYLDSVDDGESAEFITYLPVHQDGSCSGIQHYSAMLRDKTGAKAVNLMPSDTPQDIYGEVAKVVIRKNKAIADLADGEEGYSIGKMKLSLAVSRAMAESWDGIGITRSLTKKPVMTLPYGSTRITCRESIDDYLVSLEESELRQAKADGRERNAVHPFESEELEGLSYKNALNYMTSLVWPSISEVVRAPVVAMKAIRQLARAVSKLNEGLYWTTPTGFIVEQRIYATDNLRVSSYLMGRVRMSLTVETETIDEAAMMGAAAPNFVHSLDAAHLISSVCAMADAGLEFVAVIHDSFGTLACDTQTLRDALRSEMVAQYADVNRLAMLVQENEGRLLQDFGINLPEMGDFDLTEILKSDYCFA